MATKMLGGSYRRPAMPKALMLKTPYVSGVSMAPRICLGGQKSDDGVHQTRVCILVGLCGAIAPGRRCGACFGLLKGGRDETIDGINVEKARAETEMPA